MALSDLYRLVFDPLADAANELRRVVSVKGGNGALPNPPTPPSQRAKRTRHTRHHLRSSQQAHTRPQFPQSQNSDLHRPSTFSTASTSRDPPLRHGPELSPRPPHGGARRVPAVDKAEDRNVSDGGVREVIVGAPGKTKTHGIKKERGP